MNFPILEGTPRQSLAEASLRIDPGSILRAASHGLLNPLSPPCRRLERIREILCFVDDLPATELHDTHRICQSSLVRDCVFRDPEIPVSENALDFEAGRLAGMMTPQGLQVPSPENSLARLRIITNGIVVVNIVFRVCITGRRRAPARVERRADLILLHGLLLWFCFHFHLPLE